MMEGKLVEAKKFKIMRIWEKEATRRLLKAVSREELIQSLVHVI
jgi:hypothetical protein